jgi:uncharacterized protein (TIGR02588 family)
MKESNNGEYRRPNGQDPADGRARQPPAQPPLWEKTFALFGLVLTLGLLAYLGYQAIFGDTGAPIIEITVQSVTPRGDDYLVSFEAYNRGQETAASVEIEGMLSRRGQTVETGRVTLSYMPADSRLRGGLFFRNNPDELELSIKAMGYAQP